MVKKMKDWRSGRVGKDRVRREEMKRERMKWKGGCSFNFCMHFHTTSSCRQFFFQTVVELASRNCYTGLWLGDDQKRTTILVVTAAQFIQNGVSTQFNPTNKFLNKKNEQITQQSIQTQPKTRKTNILNHNSSTITLSKKVKTPFWNKNNLPFICVNYAIHLGIWNYSRNKHK